MPTVSGTFTEAGVSSTLTVKRGDTFSATIAGSMTGSIKIEKRESGGAAYEQVGVPFTAAGSQTFAAEDYGDNVYRLKCTALTAGTPTYSLTDGKERIEQWADLDGNVVMAVDQDGVVAAAIKDATFTADPKTSSGVGAKNGATVTVAEKGDGVLHKTVLTCAATPIAFGDEAGQGQYGGVKVYDFPVGAVCILGGVINGAVTLTTPAIATWDGDVGLGVEAPTDHQDVAGKTGSVLQKTSTTQAVALVAACDAKSAAAALTESGARWLDGTGTAKDLFLNFLVDDNVAHDNTITGAFTGTITVTWINLGTTA